jgi:hypothetical protein
MPHSTAPQCRWLEIAAVSPSSKPAPITPEIRSEPRAYRDHYGNVTQMRTGSIGRKPVEALSEATHGLRRSNADKRRAVAILLEDPLVSADPETGAPWSDREIARRCAVDHTFVGRLRSSLVLNTSEPTPVTSYGTKLEGTRAYRDRYGSVRRSLITVISEPAPGTGEIRSEPAPRAYRDRYGNVTQMRTGAIGRKPAEVPQAPDKTVPRVREEASGDFPR